MVNFEIFSTKVELGEAAAAHAAKVIQIAAEKHGKARVIAATGNSQLDFIQALAWHRDVAWEQVEVFHMDEYVGMPDTHPASFRLWIKGRIEETMPVARVHYLHGDADDLESEIRRYSELLGERAADVAFVGFGENGHIAFNEPGVADFKDPLRVKIVELDDASRRQQTGEGHFPTLVDVPLRALSLTCSELFRASAWICCVPEKRKAAAVRMALQGPVSEACPASLVQRHPNARVFLDSDSAALL